VNTNEPVVVAAGIRAVDDFPEKVMIKLQALFIKDLNVA